MATKRKVKIAVDIRDSVADWSPYLPQAAPEGAPNVLIVAWDVFGGPIETPTMARVADRGVRYSNFHTTALFTHPRIAADRP
ncbi:hypothetical protein [Rhodococcus sp. USK10]|uniref:hypothetical protein n=1 Tax=Rhodococcus sp. USK10 TaxID=2789739 RepID=UPI0035B523F4